MFGKEHGLTTSTRGAADVQEHQHWPKTSRIREADDELLDALEEITFTSSRKFAKSNGA